MKMLASSLAQLAAIVMLLVTLAVSTAAVSQWMSTAAPQGNQPAASQPLMVSEARPQAPARAIEKRNPATIGCL
jgi:hypothetical protein